MAKIIKNTTNTNIFIKESGQNISALGQITIEPGLYSTWAKPEMAEEIIASINTGALVVNDGTDDLTPSRGLAHLLTTNATHLNGILLDQATIADGRAIIYDS